MPERVPGVAPEVQIVMQHGEDGSRQHAQRVLKVVSLRHHVQVEAVRYPLARNVRRRADEDEPGREGVVVLQLTAAASVMS